MTPSHHGEYPITTSPEEWANSILVLDQLLVEGFLLTAIRARLDALGRPYETQWGFLKLIQELFIAQGQSTSEAADALKPLRELHQLRSKVKGHAAQEQRDALIKEARMEHGSLKEHFVQLAFGCQTAFAKARFSLTNLAAGNARSAT